MNATLCEAKIASRQKSSTIYENSCKVIPSGVNSPVRAFSNLNHTPLVIQKGFQDCITDEDNYTYIDYCQSWGALIHGHAHPAIVEAAQKRIALGSSFGTTTAIEAQIAKTITQLMPAIEKVRFVSSGTEATMSAIRLARAYTERNIIIKFSGNYHGHADPFLVQAGSGVALLSPTSSSKGIPQDSIKYTLCLPYNDSDALTQAIHDFGHDIAAVIIEPIAANMGVVPATEEFLFTLRNLTYDKNILLIFDEVVTGFRVGLDGASGYYGIDPDLTCLGKIIGGGFPAAAFGGRADIMDLLAPQGPVYQAGTLSGNPVAMEAGYKALELLQKEDFYQNLEKKTQLLVDPIANYIEASGINVCLQRVGSMFTLFFGLKSVANFEEGKKLHLQEYERFFKHLFSQGIYVAPSQYEANFISMAHTEDNLIYTREVILDYLSRLG